MSLNSKSCLSQNKTCQEIGLIYYVSERLLTGEGMELTNRQKEIVLNTIHIISKQGIQDLTIKNISAAINVTEAAIYRHFTSKNELLMEVLNYFEGLADHMINEVESSGKSQLEKIEMFVMQRYDLFRNNPDLAKVMFSEVMFENDHALSQKMLSIIQKHMHLISEYIEKAQTEGLIRNDIKQKQIFRMIVGSMRLLVTQWTLSDYSFPLEEEGKKLWEAVEKTIKN
jgi:AcrR family transcriptional regulator